MKVYVCNAFSLNMLDGETQLGGNPRYANPVPGKDGHEAGSTEAALIWLQEYRKAAPDLEIVSVVGHKDTAAMFTELLGFPVLENRESIKLYELHEDLARREVALIGQLQGTRLPPGATTLPDGATLEWWLA